MSQCKDKRFADMLHAFELGLLNDRDYEAFRLHLLDCRYCFERAQKFEAAAELMRNDPDIRQIPAAVLEEQSKPATDMTEEKLSRFRPKFRPALIPASVVVAVIIVILLLKPWHVEIRPGQEAFAAENRLAVLYFDNLAASGDPQRLGEITANLLIADLSESSFLQVISSQRLHDILRLLAGEDKEITDQALAFQIAAKAGARWMITGSILQVEPQLIISSQIAEVSTGNVVASQQITGTEETDIFSLVDQLTVQVKNDLSLPIAARQEPDRRVADVTTHSSLAYRYYLEGVVNYQRYYNSEAAESFRKALEIDSAFAMAYYYLSLIDDPNLIDKAMEYLDRTGSEEGHFIRSRRALLSRNIDSAIRELLEVLERNPDNKEACYNIALYYSSRLEFDKSIHYYSRAVEIDPLYKIAYNQMAYTNDWMGEFEKAIEAIDMYISLAPEEANPYDSRGEILTRNGRLQAAIDSYTRALKIKPDYWTSLYKLGNNYLFTGKLTAADSCFRVLAACDDRLWSSRGRAALAYIPIYQGRFDEAIRILDEGIAATKAEADEQEPPLFHQLKAIAYEEKMDLIMAIKECEESIRLNRLQFPDDKKFNRHVLAQLLAQSGDIEKAEEVADDFKKILASARDTLRYWYAAAAIELAQGNLDRALTGFEKAAEDSVIPYTPANGLLASVYVQTGRWSDAIEELENLLARDFTENRLYYGSWTARAHYLMGLSHEGLGQSDLAIEQYQLFLDLWKNADPGISIVDDAQKRLSRLKSKS